MSDVQSRKWFFTFNNPAEHGDTHESVAGRFSELSLAYWCLGDEIGAETGTYHTHGFIYSPSPIRFTRLKKLFPFAHIEKANGTCKENRDYVAKENKFSNDPTKVEGSFEEHGELPKEREPKEDRKERLYAMVEAGLTTEEIIELDKSFIFQANTIDGLIQRRLASRHKGVNRSVAVIYIWGETGTGKTRSIQERHSADGICRITSYRNGAVSFDAYKGEPVLVFEEFNSQIAIEEMLNYLDVYPLMLPARYSDKVACFTQVYITSNIPLEKQYPEVQRTRPATWRAFLRRIGKIAHHLPDGSIEETLMERGKDAVKPQRLF
ncbi:hypothetical protein [Eggerthella sp. YY7918]|uniref:hypothetical protein n=1 Tax=Eggerthella sp. (strain YY7918) TaxID=502558 RepID=UPI0002170F77|nr:hypothetical protein [Eggerthella sp. YY7918]BAK43300.1 hypothetical protein EGYY_00170 [Eggerthella sp. YY7918]